MKLGELGVGPYIRLRSVLTKKLDKLKKKNLSRNCFLFSLCHGPSMMKTADETADIRE